MCNELNSFSIFYVMINNNDNRLVNFFRMLELRSYDRMQLNQKRDLAHLPVTPVVKYI